MKVTLWGTRGSLPTPGFDTSVYGGNTSCVAVEGARGTMLILDAGTGIRRLGMTMDPGVQRVDILLTHLHMDHIQGLGFFPPLYRPDLDVHIWGPSSTKLDLRTRLMRYLSPPLFPVRLTELPCALTLHEVPRDETEIGEFHVDCALVCHPGPTVGYRITDGQGSVVTYLPDHEPALGAAPFPSLPREWTSGGALAEGSDLLIHDSQYSGHEYDKRIGWGHSSLRHTLDFGALTDAKHVVPFHHDPSHSDVDLERLMREAIDEAKPRFRVTPAREGMTFEI
jgi:phosphoribosyl 1,2-cyclic phosphodiesterase